MAYSDITEIVAGFEAQAGFPIPLLELIRELPALMAEAENLFGPRDPTIKFDLKFEGGIYTDFSKTPVLITIESANCYKNADNSYNVSEARFRLCQELTQIMTIPAKGGTEWRNLDKSISTYFTLLQNTSGPWVSGSYEKAQRLFLKLVGSCGDKVIRKIREVRWGAGKNNSFADIEADDFRTLFPTLPASIILDLFELWDRGQPVFPRERIWSVL